jgi:hypothetical protein
MLSLLMGWGLGKWPARLIAYVGLPLLAVLALWLALHFYGVHRYHQGEAANEAKWQAASAKLHADAAKSATKADDKAAVRLDDYEKQASAEQARVEEAKANGSSIFDVLFNP